MYRFKIANKEFKFANNLKEDYLESVFYKINNYVLKKDIVHTYIKDFNSNYLKKLYFSEIVKTDNYEGNSRLFVCGSFSINENEEITAIHFFDIFDNAKDALSTLKTYKDLYD